MTTGIPLPSTLTEPPAGAWVAYVRFRCAGHRGFALCTWGQTFTFSQKNLDLTHHPLAVIACARAAGWRLRSGAWTCPACCAKARPAR